LQQKVQPLSLPLINFDFQSFSMDTSNAMNFSSTNQTDAKLGISKTVCHGLPLPTNSINNQPDPKGRSGSGAHYNFYGQSPSSRFA
jgi:hypothetical protein